MNYYLRFFSGVVSSSITVFGLMTVLPNAMISDCGNKEAFACAYRGLTASGMFVTTGLYGIATSIFTPRHIKYTPLLFALSTAIQISAFMPLNKQVNHFEK